MEFGSFLSVALMLLMIRAIQDFVVQELYFDGQADLPGMLHKAVKYFGSSGF